MHLCRPAKGQRLESLPAFSVPWRFCNCYGFFLVFEILKLHCCTSEPAFVTSPFLSRETTTAAIRRLHLRLNFVCSVHPQMLEDTTRFVIYLFNSFAQEITREDCSGGGEEADKFWGVRRILPEFPRTCPKNFCVRQCEFSLTKIKTFFEKKFFFSK